MAEGWIKLYRKAKNNPILRDANAWQMFCWILLNIDRETGTYTTGRYMLAEALNMKPPTVQKVLLRLQNVYKVLSLESNHRFTKITLLNWSKYQTDENSANRVSQVVSQAVSPSVSQRRITRSSHEKDALVSQEHISKIQKSYQKRITKQEGEEQEREYINNNDEPLQKSDDFSVFRERVEGSTTQGIHTEFQDQALRIITALEIPKPRYGAYFKAVKEEPRGYILDAYQFAADYQPKDRRDKMFFWRLNKIKEEKLARSS